MMGNSEVICHSFVCVCVCVYVRTYNKWNIFLIECYRCFNLHLDSVLNHLVSTMSERVICGESFANIFCADCLKLQLITSCDILCWIFPSDSFRYSILLQAERSSKIRSRGYEFISHLILSLPHRVLGFDSRQGLGIFLFTTASRTALRHTHSPVQWVPGTLSLGVRRLGRQFDHSLPYSAEVKEWVELHFSSPNTPSWRGARLKKTQRQLHLILPYYSCISGGLHDLIPVPVVSYIQIVRQGNLSQCRVICRGYRYCNVR
jgi:hypothetical protein